MSVSLGSASRDHCARLYLLGQAVDVCRQGCQGDLALAARRIAEADADPTVAAIGLGGIDRYLTVGTTRYPVREAEALAAAARRTPVVDGGGLKAVWEPQAVEWLCAAGVIKPPGPVLMVSAMDRYFLAEAFERQGFKVICGDLVFAAGVDYPIQGTGELATIARRLLPVVLARPFRELYPVGDAQDAPPEPRFARYFEQAAVIAGDFHFIRRYLPDRLGGQIIVTNTTTAGDRRLLAERGAGAVVTMSPVVGGRSLGANALEAALVAVGGVQYPDSGWAQVVAAAGLQPTVEWMAGRPDANR